MGEGTATEVRLGRWQEALADVGLVDAVITDAPYSERTHAGFRSGSKKAGSIGEQRGIAEYPPLTEKDVIEFVSWWHGRTKHWFVIFGDHVTQQWWADALEVAGWYVFAPVAWIRRDAPPRFSGDGPQRSAEWLTVARRREKTSCGSLPGYYLVNRVEEPVNGSVLPGQKNLAGMRALVRDYTEPGWLVADPYAGTGTTLLAAEIEGRYAIGAEAELAAFTLAQKRLSEPRTKEMFGG